MNNMASAQRQNQARVNALLSEPGALIGSLEVAGVAARVINTPTAFLQDADGEVPKETIPRINDEVAALVSKNPGKLYGLATVDVFSGDEGARELNRAVREMGLRGGFIESGKGDLLLNAPQARPTLAMAAALGVPVFVHPVTDPQMHKRFQKAGPLGIRLARGTINSLALVALLKGGVFDELPKLQVVVTTLAIGGVLMAGGFGDGHLIRRDAPELTRRHVYVDTINPAAVGAMIELFGADRVRVPAKSLHHRRPKRRATADGGQREYHEAPRTCMTEIARCSPAEAAGCPMRMPRRLRQPRRLRLGSRLHAVVDSSDWPPADRGQPSYSGE